MQAVYAIRQISTGALLPVDSTQEHSAERSWVRQGHFVGWGSEPDNTLVFVSHDREIVETLLRDGIYEPGTPGTQHGFIQLDYERLYDVRGIPIARDDLELAELKF